MDDRYLYRGICTQKSRDFEGKWVYGDHVTIGGRHYIHPQANSTDVSEAGIAKLLIMHPVDPATIGQCTGLSAEISYRGKRPEDLLIFEGDVARKRLGKDRYYDTEIVWIAAGFERHGIHGYHPIHGSELEICGNIHDHPELMEAQP